MIYPNHTEDARSRQETLKLIEETHPFSAMTLFPGLFPGSRWWDNPPQYGFHVDDLNAYRRSLLHVKMKLFLPLELWDLFDYRLDGKEMADVVRECLDFSASIGELGIRTGVPDEVILFADILDRDSEELRNSIVSAFLKGDVDSIEELACQISANGSAD